MSFSINATDVLWLVPGPLGQSKAQIFGLKNPDELSQ